MTCCNHNCRQGRDCPFRPVRKFTLWAAFVALFSGCLEVPDALDAGTTGLVVLQGGVERNPLIGAAGDGAAPLVALAAKSGARYLAEGTEAEGIVNAGANAAGWWGFCHNGLQLVTSIEFSTSLAIGAACGAASFYNDRDLLIPPAGSTTYPDGQEGTF